MPRGKRAREVFKKKNKPPPKTPEGDTFDGELGPEELEIPRAKARLLRREALRRLMRRHI
jgi:hypothetical protein